MGVTILVAHIFIAWVIAARFFQLFLQLRQLVSLHAPFRDVFLVVYSLIRDSWFDGFVVSCLLLLLILSAIQFNCNGLRYYF